MSTRDHTSRSPSIDVSDISDVRHNVEDDDAVRESQILQRLERMERVLSSMEDRMTSGKGSHKVITDKPNVRNWMMCQLAKGWVTEDEIIEFSVKENKPWQTTGVRSFVKKLKTQMGIDVDSVDDGGVRRYRLAK